MARDVRTYLFDIITATHAVDRFTAKVTFETYLADEILISAVERQCSVIGEAVTQLVKLEPVFDSGGNAAPNVIGRLSGGHSPGNGPKRRPSYRQLERARRRVAFGKQGLT